jgi:hypothetical protein
VVDVLLVAQKDFIIAQVECVLFAILLAEHVLMKHTLIVLLALTRLIYMMVNVVLIVPLNIIKILKRIFVVDVILDVMNVTGLLHPTVILVLKTIILIDMITGKNNKKKKKK